MLVGTVAKLLNSGREPDETLVAVAGALQTGLPAEHVALWYRDTRTGSFRSAGWPAHAYGKVVESLEAVELLDEAPLLPPPLAAPVPFPDDCDVVWAVGLKVGSLVALDDAVVDVVDG